MLFIVPDR